MKRKDCLRCGFCCIIAPCAFSPEYETEDDCSYLYIHKDLHTSCLCAAAMREYIGSGCIFRSIPGKKLRRIYNKHYCITERKKEMCDEQLARIRCAT